MIEVLAVSRCLDIYHSTTTTGGFGVSSQISTVFLHDGCLSLYLTICVKALPHKMCKYLVMVVICSK